MFCFTLYDILFSSSNFIFTSIINILSGALYDHLESYLVPFLCAGIPPIIGAFILFTISCNMNRPEVRLFPVSPVVFFLNSVLSFLSVYYVSKCLLSISVLLFVVPYFLPFSFPFTLYHTFGFLVLPSFTLHGSLYYSSTSCRFPLQVCLSIFSTPSYILCSSLQYFPAYLSSSPGHTRVSCKRATRETKQCCSCR